MGALVSALVHASAFLTLIAMMRISNGAPQAPSVAALIPQHLVWIPHDATGGGSDGGGQRSADPPRRIEAVGRDSTSAMAATQPAFVDADVEPPEALPALPVKPSGDAMQMVPGVIDSAGVSLGPGLTGVGQTATPGDGLGSKQGTGIGDAVGVGAPGVTAPTLVERVSPKYTVEAMHARIQGTALVECVVQIDGSVSDARIIRSLDRRFGLDEEALTAARRWRFKPGLLHGKPVPVLITIELMFTVR